MYSYAFAISNPSRLLTCQAETPDIAIAKVQAKYPDCFIMSCVQMNVDAHSPDVEVPPPGTPGSTNDPNNPVIIIKHPHTPALPPMQDFGATIADLQQQIKDLKNKIS